MKKEDGITLIALIITIIVMLILVGVTVNVAINGGLISTAQKAVSGMDMAQIQERAEMVKVGLIADLERGNSGTVLLKQEYANKLASEFGVSEDNVNANRVTVEDGKYDIIIKNADLDIEVVEHSDELVVSLASVERKNTEVGGKIYASTLWFDLKINMTQEEYRAKAERLPIDEKRNTVLDNWNSVYSEELGIKASTIDELVIAELNYNYGMDYEDLGGWKEYIYENYGIENATTEQIYYFNYEWDISEEEDGYTEEELINKLYLYSYPDTISAYAMENGEKILIKKNMLSPYRFSYSVCENGEYEIVLINGYNNKEISREKIIINDIVTANNPAIVPANADWQVNDYGYITSYSGEDTNIVIPSKIGNIKVKGINDSVFEGNQKIESVVISEGIKQICLDVFYGCSNLFHVEIPSTVRGIFNAFRFCTTLKQITIPNGVTWIQEKAFQGCTDITFTFEAGPNEVPDGFPWGATNATLIDLNNPTE